MRLSSIKPWSLETVVACALLYLILSISSSSLVYASFSYLLVASFVFSATNGYQPISETRSKSRDFCAWLAYNIALGLLFVANAIVSATKHALKSGFHSKVTSALPGKNAGQIRQEVSCVEIPSIVHVQIFHFSCGGWRMQTSGLFADK